MKVSGLFTVFFLNMNVLLLCFSKEIDNQTVNRPIYGFFFNMNVVA